MKSKIGLNNFFKIKLKLHTKLILFNTIIIMLVALLLSAYSTSLIAKIVERYIGEKALAVSKVVSKNPYVIEKVKKEEGGGELQKYIEQLRKDVGAEFIVIGNENEIRLTHPDEWKIGKKMVGGDSWRALKYGESYISKAVGTLGPSIRGKTPVFDENNNIIGIVSVGFLIKDIRQIINKYATRIKLLVIELLIISTILSVILAKNVKKSIFNLEPAEIASLYNEKNTIWNLFTSLYLLWIKMVILQP